MRGLLLDIGGVVIRTPFELFAATERAHGLVEGALGPRGPFGPPGSDPEFDAVGAGTLTERAYWNLRAERAAPLLDIAPTIDTLVHTLFELPRDEIVRPETAALVAEAEAAGHPIGVLTNDLEDFHGGVWLDDLRVFVRPLQALVDGSITGHLKPAPEAYALAIEAMGRAPGDLVYVDDQPVNITGGASAGLIAVHLDVLDPVPALDQARAALGLPLPAGR